MGLWSLFRMTAPSDGCGPAKQILLQACSKSYHPIFRFGENVVQNEADARTPVTPTIDPEILGSASV